MSKDQKKELTVEEQEKETQKILLRMQFVCKIHGIKFEELSDSMRNLVRDMFVEGVKYWQEEYEKAWKKTEEDLKF